MNESWGVAGGVVDSRPPDVGGGVIDSRPPPIGGGLRFQAPFDRGGHRFPADSIPLFSSPLVIINECPLKVARFLFWFWLMSYALSSGLVVGFLHMSASFLAQMWRLKFCAYFSYYYHDPGFTTSSRSLTPCNVQTGANTLTGHLS